MRGSREPKQLHSGFYVLLFKLNPNERKRAAHAALSHATAIQSHFPLGQRRIPAQSGRSPAGSSARTPSCSQRCRARRAEEAPLRPEAAGQPPVLSPAPEDTQCRAGRSPQPGADRQRPHRARPARRPRDPPRPAAVSPPFPRPFWHLPRRRARAQPQLSGLSPPSPSPPYGYGRGPAASGPCQRRAAASPRGAVPGAPLQAAAAAPRKSREKGQNGEKRAPHLRSQPRTALPMSLPPGRRLRAHLPSAPFVSFLI